jgi:hypothetical protein
MTLWSRLKKWRRDRKAERDAIRRSERSLLRAGDEPEREVDPLQETTILGPKL